MHHQETPRESTIKIQEVAILGPPFQVDVLKAMLEYYGFSGFNCFKRCNNYVLNVLKYLKYNRLILKGRHKVLHVIYPSHKLSIKLATNAFKQGLKIVLHWIGSDVLLAKRKVYYNLDIFRRALNVAVAPWLKDELEGMDIPTSEIIPLIPPDIVSTRREPLPKKFRILYYLPFGRETLYTPEIISRIAEALKDVEIYVVGGGRGPSHPNVVHIGKVERKNMPEIYKKTVVLVRYTSHDGLPLMILEALSYGRYVIFNKPLEGVIYVRNEEEVINKLEDLKNKFNKGNLNINNKSIQFRNTIRNAVKNLLSLWHISDHDDKIEYS